MLKTNYFLHLKENIELRGQVVGAKEDLLKQHNGKLFYLKLYFECINTVKISKKIRNYFLPLVF